MMRVLILIHRWLGIAFCLLFAMWFSTGMVMHVVAFPALTEAERVAGLAPLDLHEVAHGPADAVQASGIAGATRARLMQRSDGPVYLVSGAGRLQAVRAGDLASAAVHSDALALTIAIDHARRRGIDAARATLVALDSYDQWTVPNRFDPHRPLYRVGLNDDAGSEVYVSSATGEIVLDTTRRERGWNTVGSVAHWIYPTLLRKHSGAWQAVVWWLSLAALMGALSGAVLGTLRIRLRGYLLVSPYRGLQAWHHVLGLMSMTFVLTWIFSGWLSVDDGRLFSSGRLSDAEASAVTGAPAWTTLSAADLRDVDPGATEVEWFAFDGKLYRRERTALTQRLVLPSARAAAPAFLTPDDVRSVAHRLAPGCAPPVTVDPSDDYAIGSITPDAPVYRLVCDDVWYHLDGADGAVLEKLDHSRRVYRWLYSALHTFDIPALTGRPALRTTLIMLGCGLGFAFSLTGVAIGWRRLRRA
jgi:PepSY-associated transmembrane protein